MTDCIAIVSGGMDSVTLLHYLVKKEKRTPAVISFLYGQKHAREIQFAQHHADLLGCQPHQIIDLSPFKAIFNSSALVSESTAIPHINEVQGNPQPATYVPNRNMIFLSLAAAYAETMDVSDVFYGAQRQDMYGYWDTTPQFLKRVNAVYALNRKTPAYIVAPFVDHSKADILRIGIELSVNYGTTWSCYKGQDMACGVCPTCAERLAAFKEVGIKDPLPYARSKS
jgi:7-cyano-7-deazaguanine synthase